MTKNIIATVEIDAWWLKEKSIDTELPKDVMDVGRRLIVFDVNGVLLKSYDHPPLESVFQTLPRNVRPKVYRLGQRY